MQVPSVGTFELPAPEGGVPIGGTTLILGDATGLGEVTVPGQVSGTDLDLAGGEVECPILEALTPRTDLDKETVLMHASPKHSYGTRRSLLGKR